MQQLQPLEVLKNYWNFDQFRPLQEDIIQSVLARKDTLALLPTGGGKSICFQVPALAQEGICIVVSPLIALMKDQVYNLKMRGIEAKAIFSGMGKREIDYTLDNCVYGKVKFLYVSPERLKTDIFKERVQKMKVNLIAVDEAHCISQWGYDFRPPYLEIAEIRKLIPDVPVLALTASATEQVQEDIQEKLLFEKKNIFRKSFLRENISYSVFYEENKAERLLTISKKVGGTGIIYVRNRRKTREVAEFLYRNGISADYYHAGLTPDQRNAKQENWINNKTRIIVCTNAFGMGIDKPDVRFVVHLDLPDNLESYYQESGRAGRDEKKSYAVILYDKNDLEMLQKGIDKKYPSVKEIKRVYQALGYYFNLAVGAGENVSFDFDLNIFIKQFEFDAATAFNALKVLEAEGYIAITDAVFLAPRLQVTGNREALYKFEVENRKLEPLLKLILRSYEGVFDHFAKIDLNFISRQLNTDRNEIEKALLFIEQIGIIEYEPMKDKPQIIYLKPRFADDNLYINTNFLKERKNIYKNNVESVIHYVENKLHCRSRVILNYFDEKETIDCGKCDICIEKKKKDILDSDIKRIEDKIKIALMTSKYSVKSIKNAIEKEKSEDVITVLRLLIDEGKLVENENEEINWNN